MILSNAPTEVPSTIVFAPVCFETTSEEDVVKYGLNKKCGLLVNNSRNIIYADSSEKFAKVAGEKAREMQFEMEQLLKANNLV